MNLPNADKAIVEREKIENYLLAASHPDNGGKAQFFETFGFHRKNWKLLAAAFLELAREAEVTHRAPSPHGQKYVIVGRIKTPGGRLAKVQTIWIVDKGLETARLVSAYPRKE
jgi:hypothetical protein